MKTKERNTTRLKIGLAALLCIGILAGCGSGGGGHGESAGPTDFERGFDDGFADDSEYFLGFDESLFTIGFGPILYSAGDIPFIDDFSYDAGFFDGLFDAHNDGYFIAYRDAFIIGFSEGYDNAFAPDFLDFLAGDLHLEFENGGFSDGYEDGFTEGRVFGAFDFEAFLPFDWLDALFDWEDGTDLVFDEVGVGTGVFGPAELYEYGTDPNLARAADARNGSRQPGAITLRPGASRSHRPLIDRGLTASQEAEFDVTPFTTPRTNRDLTILDSWLDRILAHGSARSAEGVTRNASPRRDSARARTNEESAAE